MTIEQVMNTIDNNSNIDAPLKENLKELVVTFNNMFPGVSLEALNSRIGSLNIVKSSKFANKRVSKYNPGSNTLEFNIEKIEQGYDMKYIMMYELLNIITSNNNCMGFSFENNFKGLNAGYTAILANNLVGNDSEIPFLEDEIILTNLIGTMVGNDVLLQSYFTNNPNLLANSLGNDLYLTQEIDYVHENSNSKISKQLSDDIIVQLTKSFVSKERSSEQISSYENWLSVSGMEDELIPIIEQYKIQIDSTKKSRLIA